MTTLLKFTNVEMAGFAAESALPGQEVKVIVSHSLTSDTSLFHDLIESVQRVISHLAQEADARVAINHANTVLLLIKPDKSAELWLDTVMSIMCAVKRDVKAGEVVYDKDIADVIQVSFPEVKVSADDKVLCIFRQDWKFALAFDFNPETKLDWDEFTCKLGTLYRELRYRHLYEVLENKTQFERVISLGWFPFVEIVPGDFWALIQHLEAGFDLADFEKKLVAQFDEVRLNHLYDRWVKKPYLIGKKNLLKAAFDAFLNGEPIATIKILLTEIEGILNEAHKQANDGRGARIKDLLEFAISSAQGKSRHTNSLLFPHSFGEYLNAYTFSNFDPKGNPGSAGSRHAVGHGAAGADSYTMARALQAILTVDQLIFYI